MFCEKLGGCHIFLKAGGQGVCYFTSKRPFKSNKTNPASAKVLERQNKTFSETTTNQMSKIQPNGRVLFALQTKFPFIINGIFGGHFSKFQGRVIFPQMSTRESCPEIAVAAT